MSYALTIFAFALIYSVLALGLNLQMGYAGILNFGYVAFVAIGAYTSGLLTVELGWPFPMGWAAAALLSALVGYPLGLLTIRVGGDYLAVVTLAFSQLVALVILNQEGLTHGAIGLVGISRPFADLGPGPSATLTVILMVAMTILVLLLIWRITRSPLGRLLRAIQDNEPAAQAVGKNTVGYKVLALVIGSGVAGLAGAMYAHWVQYISPGQFSPDVTFNVFIALILGGVGSLIGSVTGAFVLMIFLQGSILFQDYITFVSATQLSALRFIVIGFALLLLILYRPSGIFGRREGKRRRRTFLQPSQAVDAPAEPSVGSGRAAPGRIVK